MIQHFMPVPAQAIETLLSLITELRSRNSRKMRFAEFMAVLLAILLWQTRWLQLRPGLIILLLGQLGLVLLLLNRNLRLSREAERAKSHGLDKVTLLAWFEDEDAFAKRSSRFENVVRIAGLVVLAYGFWAITRNVWIAAAIGVVYPASLYFGMMRQGSASVSRYLEKRKGELTLML